MKSKVVFVVFVKSPATVCKAIKIKINIFRSITNKDVLKIQEILDVCGVLTVNAHELPITTVPVQALYANISLLGNKEKNPSEKTYLI